MQINQHNYEEFFLMYVDNELSLQEKEMVEAFVAQHTELAGELELLKQTVSSAEQPIGFAGKGKLIKQPELAAEDLFTYLDGEAGSELADKVEQELKHNDALRLELQMLSKVYLKADPSIQYPAKEKLYKRGAVRSMDWRKLAIAASLLLCVSTWLVLNQSEQGEADEMRVAVNTPPAKLPAEAKPAIADTNNDTNLVVAPETSFLENNPGSTEKQRTPLIKTHHREIENIQVNEPVTGKTSTPNTTPAIENRGSDNKTSSQNLPAEPGTVTVEAIAKPPVAEHSIPVASVEEPVKEKKSLFKKIGKQIGDRALDILSDGGDNINVAGFAIRVEK